MARPARLAPRDRALLLAVPARASSWAGWATRREPEGVGQGSTLRFLARFARAATALLPAARGREGGPRQWAGLLRRHARQPARSSAPPASRTSTSSPGFVGHGFMMAPAVAELYADWLAGRGTRRALRAVRARAVRAGRRGRKRISSSGSARVSAHATREEDRVPRHGEHGRGAREGAPRARAPPTQDEIVCAEPRAERREEIRQRYGVAVIASNLAAARAGRRRRPVGEAAGDGRAARGDRAGGGPPRSSSSRSRPASPIAAIARKLGAGVRIVRTMPNTPALVGAGATALARGAHATDADLDAGASPCSRRSGRRSSWRSTTSTRSPASPAPARRSCSSPSRRSPTAA